MSESVQLDVFAARERTATRRAAHVQRLVPLAQELALRAGPSGITVGDIRLVAEQRGLLEPLPADRRLSWLWAVPKAAGLERTDRRRLCPQSRTRNDHVVYRLRETR